MTHLVKIFEEVKNIGLLRKKMKNDPINAPHYEKQIWKLYTIVTDHKDAYYKDRFIQNPSIKNAFVTFRSMEGK